MFHRKHHTDEMQENKEAHQEEKIQQLKAAIGSLSERQSQFCDTACLRRYLEARNWNLDKSKKMLQDTLKWRSTYKPEEIRWNEIAAEGETGKVYRANFHDRNGRSVLVLRPARQNTASQDNQVRHLVYLLENAILNLPEGEEQMVWLIDFTGWSMTKAVPVRTTKETIDVLQNHYPERLASAFLYNPPRIFEAFWKVVKYFLDEKTFKKVKFVYPKNKESMDLLRSNFDLDVVPKELGGTADYEYDHKEFSKMMAKDDMKMDSRWGIQQKNSRSSNGVVAPEPLPESVAN